MPNFKARQGKTSARIIEEEWYVRSARKARWRFRIFKKTIISIEREGYMDKLLTRSARACNGPKLLTRILRTTTWTPQNKVK